MSTDSFSEIFSKISLFLTEERRNISEDREESLYKLPVSDAFFCAEDVVRNKKFFEALQKSIEKCFRIKKEILVVDAGSGTGILGLFALFLGAKKCIFIEQNPFAMEVNKKLISHFGYEKNAVFIEGDATTVPMQEPIDILISETISSGFVEEEFPFIVEHLSSFCSTESIIIPERFEVSLLEKNDEDEILNTQLFNIETRKKNWKKAISLQKDTVFLEWTMKTFLYEDISISSGDCMSFGNMRRTNVSKQHPVFYMNKKKRKRRNIAISKPSYA